MKKIEACPICESKELNNFISCVDFTKSKKTFTISSCVNCNFKFTNPRPNEDDLSEYYISDEYISHTNNKKGLFNKLYQIARLYNINQKTKLIGNKKASLLEIGSGTGELLNAFKSMGWNTTGIEPSDIARKNAFENHGLHLFPTIEETNVKEKSQHTIMLWHVLEHIPQLNKSLKKYYNLMMDDGQLIIAVPNYKSPDANLFKEFWAAYDTPRHLYHFDKKSMKNVLEKHGFKVVKIKPMWLDAIYVSILSLKYKSNKSSFLKGFLIGVWSNIKAIMHNNEHSSLIYIAKKTK